ncbi:MAG: hypothetical protein R2734_02855 [Nocardioides sp.]
MTTTFQGLLLDVGVVLLKSAWEIADEFERSTGIPERTIPGRGPFDEGGDPLWERHLAGELTERDYWLGNADEAVRRGAPLGGHPHLMRAMFQHPAIDPARPGAVALLRAAKEAGVVTAVFSNELMDFQGREWVEAQEWFSLFDVVYDATEQGSGRLTRRRTPAWSRPWACGPSGWSSSTTTPATSGVAWTPACSRCSSTCSSPTTPSPRQRGCSASSAPDRPPPGDVGPAIVVPCRATRPSSPTARRG